MKNLLNCAPLLAGLLPASFINKNTWYIPDKRMGSKIPEEINIAATNYNAVN